MGSDSSDESSSKASSAKCDESASDATSSDEADEAETVCGECLDPLADDAPRFRDGADVHKECGQTVRAAKKKLSAKGPKVLKQFNKLKKTNPKEYSKTIKKLKKQRGKDGEAGRRSGLQARDEDGGSGEEDHSATDRGQAVPEPTHVLRRDVQAEGLESCEMQGPVQEALERRKTLQRV